MRNRTILPLLLAVLLLAGCSKPAPKAHDPAQAESILTSGAFEGSEMAPLDLDLVSILYGIDSSAIQSGVCHMAVNTSASADELLILVLTDEAAAEAAEAACRQRVASQIITCEDYCPAAVPRLKEALISRVGNTLLYAVGDPAVLSALKL